jgi:hypothetical protein
MIACHWEIMILEVHLPHDTYVIIKELHKLSICFGFFNSGYLQKEHYHLVNARPTMALTSFGCLTGYGLMGSPNPPDRMGV